MVYVIQLFKTGISKVAAVMEKARIALALMSTWKVWKLFEHVLIIVLCVGHCSPQALVRRISKVPWRSWMV
jgi:hypothetical protein